MHSKYSSCQMYVQPDNITSTWLVKVKCPLIQGGRRQFQCIDIQTKGVLFDQRSNQEGEIAKWLHMYASSARV